jgi:hypothetical protein
MSIFPGVHPDQPGLFSSPDVRRVMSPQEKVSRWMDKSGQADKPFESQWMKKSHTIQVQPVQAYQRSANYQIQKIREDRNICEDRKIREDAIQTQSDNYLLPTFTNEMSEKAAALGMEPLGMEPLGMDTLGMNPLGTPDVLHRFVPDGSLLSLGGPTITVTTRDSTGADMLAVQPKETVPNEVCLIQTGIQTC